MSADRPNKPRIGSHWKRPATRVYDYNYDISSQYYQPLMRHLDKKSAGVDSELPGPKTFAERLVEDPLYGRPKSVNYTTSDYNPPSSGRSAGFDDTAPRRAPADTRDNLGKKSAASLFDDALDDLKTKQRPKFDYESFLDDQDDAAGKRREILRNLKSDLEKMGSELETSGARRGLTAIEDSSSFGSRLAASSSTSVNIKQRSVKSTVTSETVRC